MSVIELTAHDISCDHCKRSIETDLANEPGIRSVDVSVTAQQIRIDYDEASTNRATIAAKLQEIGYPVT